MATVVDVVVFPRRRDGVIVESVEAVRIVLGASIAVVRKASGRLVASGYALSVAHTDAIIAVASAAAPTRVGIDIERVRPRPYLDRLAARSMTPGERADWDRADDPTRAFLQHWTRVEAYLKAIGTGVVGGLRQRPPAGWCAIDLQLPRSEAIDGVEHVGALAVDAEMVTVTQRAADW